MKNILLVLAFLVVSCKPTQTVNSNFTVTKIISVNPENCPENGICTIELLPNKLLEFKKDTFGILYPVISEGEKTLLKYTYQRNPIPNTVDGNYTEIIYAELDKNISELSLKDKDLQQIKLHFARLCYCKGETGYYPIKNGEFKLLKSGKNSIKIELNFKIKVVPQIITGINETILLKSN